MDASIKDFDVSFAVVFLVIKIQLSNSQIRRTIPVFPDVKEEKFLVDKIETLGERD